MQECDICFETNYIIKECCNIKYCYNCYCRFNSFCSICEKNELNKKEKCKKCKKETNIMNLYECIICYEKKCNECIIIKNFHSNLCSNEECILINNRRNNYQGPQSSYSGL